MLFRSKRTFLNLLLALLVSTAVSSCDAEKARVDKAQSLISEFLNQELPDFDSYPYYGYARQDRKARGREPITAKLMADLLETAGITRVVTIDLHAAQIQGFFNIPFDHMPGGPLLAEYIKEKKLDNMVVVSPDLGGVSRARGFAEMLNAPMAIIDKRRPEPGVAEVMNLIGNVEGKNCIMVDDMVDTAGSLTEGARALKKFGANEIYACCTHPILTDPALSRIAQSDITELVVTNTMA